MSAHPRLSPPPRSQVYPLCSPGICTVMLSIQDIRAKHQWRWYLEKILMQWEIHRLWESELETITHKCKHDVDRIAGTSRTQHQDSTSSRHPGLPTPMSYPSSHWTALPDAPQAHHSSKIELTSPLLQKLVSVFAVFILVNTIMIHPNCPVWNLSLFWAQVSNQ